MRRLLLCLLTAAAPAAAAADEPKYQVEDVSAVGKPKGYKPGLSSRYAVWYQDGWWHVRTTTGAKGGHTFAGTVEVIGGKMTSLQPVKVEGKGKKGATDAGAWNPAGTLFRFSLSTTKGFEDGFDLKVSKEAKAIKLVLKVDGEDAPGKVFVGAKAAHPKAATFHLPARPEK